MQLKKINLTFFFHIAGSSSIYCGNVKCGSFEKCGLDPQTKRQKCVRA